MRRTSRTNRGVRVPRRLGAGPLVGRLGGREGPLWRRGGRVVGGSTRTGPFTISKEGLFRLEDPYYRW